MARGERVVVIDNLSTGFSESVSGAELIVGNVGDLELVASVLVEHKVGAVMHFAAHTIVPESMSNPLKYYGNNTCNTRDLLSCCARAGIDKFIFSSTAAVYGVTESGIADEDTVTHPVNPYGASKLMSELMLRDLSAAGAMRHVILRYFNVAGCDSEGRIGHSTRQATLLIKVACEHAVGKRSSISIYGTDYPTPDGTGIRDYIHVDDLAAAHLRALDYLRGSGESLTLNCGYGHGYSVREVIDSVQRLSDRPLNVIELPRRAGDIPRLIACSDRLKQRLDWKPRHDDLDFIVGTALAWEWHLARKSPASFAAASSMRAELDHVRPGTADVASLQGS